MINLKDIHIGNLVEKKWQELDIPLDRVCNFFRCDEQEIKNMFQQKELDTGNLLRWSKLLEYDFFRLYSQHLIFYSPPAVNNKNEKQIPCSLPVFRKSLYTQELIDFIIELINIGEKTKQEVITDYKIPKTTLYKWISKYRSYERE
ncbi:transposase [Chryseobacterium antibioticum]|uniref:Transposase n=1 Tax=Chryseobacterium pyrolae TaxID=2987481 RepID=A0ABT2IKZ9_9FLAO|nr:transposase [Chryseobacterium pyrolae]MCT2409332.1 transposase [Chryseobacterium pyrolae]